MATVEQVSQLAEARAAFHKLMTGAAVVSVNKDGMSVSYKTADAGKLQAYITELSNIVEGGSRRRAPAGVRF